MRIMGHASIVTGRWISSIWLTCSMDRPIPPCMQMILFSINAASGNQLNSWLMRCHAQMPSCSPWGGQGGESRRGGQRKRVFGTCDSA